MFGIFSKNRDPWEELYDAEENTYFYRHRGTGEFSRRHPHQKEVTSSHVPQRPTDPIWETAFDSEDKAYWTDLETGKVVYTRPERGTFISEVPLKDFRLAGKIISKKSRVPSSRKSTSTRKSMRVVKRDDDFGIVNADSSDLDFEKLFGNASPAQFDAGALYGISSANNSVPSSSDGPSAYSAANISSRMDTVQPQYQQTEEAAEENLPPLDEETVLAQSSIFTDNPMFAYNRQ